MTDHTAPDCIEPVSTPRNVERCLLPKTDLPSVPFETAYGIVFLGIASSEAMKDMWDVTEPGTWICAGGRIESGWCRRAKTAEVRFWLCSTDVETPDIIVRHYSPAGTEESLMEIAWSDKAETMFDMQRRAKAVRVFLGV